MQKLKAIFDSRATWLALGTVAGSLFGENVAALVNAVGNVVMAVIV